MGCNGLTALRSGVAAVATVLLMGLAAGPAQAVAVYSASSSATLTIDGFFSDASLTTSIAKPGDTLIDGFADTFAFPLIAEGVATAASGG